MTYNAANPKMASYRGARMNPKYYRFLHWCGAVAALFGVTYYATINLGLIPYRIGDLALVAVTPDHHRPDRKTLAIKFHSNVNFRRYLDDNGISYVLADYRSCRSRVRVSDGPIEHNGVYVTDQPYEMCVRSGGGPLRCHIEDDTPAVRTEILHMRDRGSFEYTSWFFYEDYCEREGDHGCEKYTALPYPPREDVCMKLVNYVEFGPIITSNEIRIPKADIARALAQW